MSTIQIAVVVGSLRRNSYNRKLAEALARFTPSDFVLNPLTLVDLPLYNQDEDDAPPAAVQKLKSAVRAADGLLFVTPEYNRSIPGVLKNALDHASRPYGGNSWAGKPAGVLGVSVGATGTAMAQQHLRNILAYLDVPVMAQPEAFIRYTDNLFDADGAIGTESREFLRVWMHSFVVWVRRNLATKG